MVGSTRSRARVTSFKPPPSPQSSSTEDGALPDTSVGEASTLVDERSTRSSKRDSDQHDPKHDVQRLSRELEPMNLGDYNEQSKLFGPVRSF